MIHHRTPASSTNGREKNGSSNNNSSTSSSWRLPLHHASSPSAAAKAATTTTSSSNFLMGGSYYPGKDKHRRAGGGGGGGRLLNRRRRHGSDSSIGLSVFYLIWSPLKRLFKAIVRHDANNNNNNNKQRRRAVLAVAVFLLLLCIVILSRPRRRRNHHHWAEQLPIVRSIVQGKHAWWWKRDIIDELQKNEMSLVEGSTVVEADASSNTNLIHLSTRREALAMAEELLLERQRLDSQQQQRQEPKDAQQQQQQHAPNRLELLEKIVPEWYHRNDKKKTPKQEQQQQPTKNTRAKQPTTVDPPQQQQEQQRVLATNKTNVTMHQLDNKKEPVSVPLDKSEEAATAARVVLSNTTTTTPTRIAITLHSMDWENVTQHNHCPPTTTNHDDDDDEHSIQITLVTQSSLDRAWILDETCLRWNTDPIIAVIALYPPTTSNHNHDNNQTIYDEMTNISVLSSGWQQKCPHLTIISYTLSPHEAMPANYPVNHLRNLALNAVQTSHVLVVDVDFVPSRNLAQDVRQALLLRRRVRRQEQQSADYYNAEYYDALVVPAFERILNVPCATIDDCKLHLRHNHSFIPNTFDELRACVKEENCQVFQSNNNWEGHYSTRSQRWLAQDWYEEPHNTTTLTNVADNTTTSLPHDVKSIPCFDSLRYEPYVVIRWCPGGSSTASSLNTTIVRPVAPYYDERFHGYGKNKIEFIAHLRLAFYQFAILPRGFIVHNPHVESKSKQAWNNVSSSSSSSGGAGTNLHMDMDRLYPVFLRELIQKYHHLPNNSDNKNTTNRHHGHHPEHIVDSCQ